MRQSSFRRLRAFFNGFFAPMWLSLSIAAPDAVLRAAAPAPGLEMVAVPIVETIEQAPIIDGVMKKSEWRYAAGFTGLISNETPNALAQRQATFRMVTDGQYLYVGMFAPAVPAGTAPQILPGEARRHETYDEFGTADRIEAKFSPPEASGAGSVYFVGDAAGNILTQLIKGEFKVWTGDWEYKNSYDAAGWTAEMRVKLSQLGVAAVKSGDHWMINLSLVRLFPQEFAGLAEGPHKTRDAVFVKGAPACQIESLGNLSKGQLDLNLTVREYEGVVSAPKEGAYDERKVESGGLKLASTGAAAKVLCEILDGAGKVVFTQEMALALKPAVEVSARIQQSFTPDKRNTLRLRVLSAPSAAALKNGGDPSAVTTLYSAVLPFLPYNAEQEKLWAERLTNGRSFGSWQLNAAFFPYWEKAKVAASFMEGATRNKVARLRIRITSDKGFDATKEVEVRKGMLVTDNPQDLVEFAIPGLPEAVYTTKAEALDAEGKVISTQEKHYTRKVFPWEHNTLGTSRGVIKPWTPMTVSGNSIGLWGRDYPISGTGLPEQMVSQKKPLLTRPVTLRLWDSTGNEVSIQPGKEPGKAPEFTEKAEDAVRWTGASRIGEDLAVEVKGLAEYDGFTWYELTITPSRSISCSKARIEIALPESEAQLMHFQSTWARDNFSGAIPRGEGTVFRSIETVNYGRTGGFSPHVWLGNLTRGLSWFADSDEGWSSSVGKSALEIERVKGEVRLVMNVITRPTELSKPRTIRFGLMATPFRPVTPLPKIRTRAVNWLTEDGKEVFQQHMYATYPKNYDYNLADRELKRLQGTGYDGVRLYFNKHEMGAALPERSVFDNEWGGMNPSPDYPGAPERFGPGINSRTIGRQLTDSRIDMMVYYIAEMARKTCMAGTYWDITGISSGLPMTENGTAYVDPENGTIKPTFDILKSRQLFKRVATAWQEIRGSMDLMEMHTTNHMGIPFYSFAPVWLNFEWLNPTPKALREDGRWMDFIDLRPLDVFATEGSPSQFGSWVKSINHGKRPAELGEIRRIERSATALGSLHNHESGIAPMIGKREELEFVGYWNEDGRVTSDVPLVRASFWKGPGELELVVVNLSPKDEKALITLRPAVGSWKSTVISEITPEEEMDDIRNSAVRTKNKARIAEITEILEKAKAARTLPSLKSDGALLTLPVHLPSHDYRVFRISAKP